MDPSWSEQSDPVTEPSDRCTERDVDQNNVTPSCLPVTGIQNPYAEIFVNSHDPSTLISLLSRGLPEPVQKKISDNEACVTGNDNDASCLDPTLRDLSEMVLTQNLTATSPITDRDDLNDDICASYPPSPSSSLDSSISSPPESLIKFNTPAASADPDYLSFNKNVDSAYPPSPSSSLDDDALLISPIASKFTEESLLVSKKPDDGPTPLLHAPVLSPRQPLSESVASLIPHLGPSTRPSGDPITFHPVQPPPSDTYIDDDTQLIPTPSDASMENDFSPFKPDGSVSNALRFPPSPPDIAMKSYSVIPTSLPPASSARGQSDMDISLPSPPSYMDIDSTSDVDHGEQSFAQFQYQNPPDPPPDMEVDSPPELLGQSIHDITSLSPTIHGEGFRSYHPRIPEQTPSSSTHQSERSDRRESQDSGTRQKSKGKEPVASRNTNRRNKGKRPRQFKEPTQMDIDTPSESSSSESDETSDESGSNTPKHSKKRSPRVLLLQRTVRQHVRDVTNRRTRSAPYPPPPSQDTIDRYLDGGPGPSLAHFEYHYNSSVTHPWNEEAIELVLHDLIEIRGLTDYRTSEVRNALQVHFRSISRKYRSFIQPSTRKSQEQIRVYRSNCSRRQRRTRVYHRRKTLCKGFPSLKEDLDILEKLGIGGMSSDESDHTPGHHDRPNPIHQLSWRSSSVTPWLRMMDAAHEALKEERTGHRTHTRIDSRIPSKRRVAPKGLPQNFYNPRWLSNQKPLALLKLKIVEEDFDFAKSQTYLQTQMT